MHRPHADFRFGHAEIRFLRDQISKRAANKVAASIFDFAASASLSAGGQAGHESRSNVPKYASKGLPPGAAVTHPDFSSTGTSGLFIGGKLLHKQRDISYI
jgi:hypothetical protein